jgi:starch synthase
MNTLCILYVASELAPLTSDGPFAKEVHYLTRAMAELGFDVTVAVPGHRVPEPRTLGLARRLEPLLVPSSAASGAGDGFESTVHEGKLGGGRVKILAVDVPVGLRHDARQSMQAFCRAAVTAAVHGGLQPDTVLAGPGTELALPLARAAWERDGRRPVTLLALRGGSDPDALASVLPQVDHIVVPSPSGAAQVRALPATEPLGRVLEPRRDAIAGVLGGIDAITWNPQQDRLDIHALETSKAEHKRQLKRRLGLHGGAQVPLLALIGPFDADILTESAAAELVLCDASIVVLTDAERDRATCQRFEQLARRGHVVLHVATSPQELHGFEHELLCAADLALFARRHPDTAVCELHAMHYGVAPIAPRGPVYSDLLSDFEMRTGTGSGFLFDAEKGGQLAAAVDRALRAYRQPRAFHVLTERASSFDLSWRTTAVRYAEIILHARRAQPGYRAPSRTLNPTVGQTSEQASDPTSGQPSDPISAQTAAEQAHLAGPGVSGTPSTASAL